MCERWGVEISAFPLTWHIAYTTPCCYRTSRESQIKLYKLIKKQTTYGNKRNALSVYFNTDCNYL